jgi:hypothetical protein
MPATCAFLFPLCYLKQYDLQFYVCIVNNMIYCYFVSYAVRLVLLLLLLLLRLLP